MLVAGAILILAISATVAIDTRYKSMSHRESIDVLYKWCATNVDCSRAFQINGLTPWRITNNDDDSSSSSDSDEDYEIGDDEKSQHGRRHFAFLFSKWVEDFDQNDVNMHDFVEHHFHFRHANDADIHSSLRSHWISIMCNAANRRGQARCGVNKQLFVSEESLDGDCVCLPNRDCNDGGDWRPIINWESAVILALILLSLSMCVNIYKNSVFIQLYMRLDAQCRQQCDVRSTLDSSKNK